MNKERIAILGLLFVALMATVTVVAHMACIPLGEACYRAQLAPEFLIEAAKQGTLLAPVATVFVSGLFGLCAAYALAGAGYMKRLPLTKLALITIATLCTLRGLAGMGLSFVLPELVTLFSVVASALWFICGVLTFLALKWLPSIPPLQSNITTDT
ncbi:hypothetical protein [Pseudoalteromonas luteoviolacea]|uniref:Uncharacterized protein n=1 Tax=Pseudoalteromonas luteoviolacea NCIMB 1942 TaxID=1365253 RepID=A0A167GA89_9GAMM|nr:hypothetical protein [Pseudoalteromonas luteoviolacea]KZN54775.1 hypothetical protein N482_24510 [Pseudoalteromonas luteoviolacea NCIMB 1942]